MVATPRKFTVGDPAVSRAWLALRGSDIQLVDPQTSDLSDVVGRGVLRRNPIADVTPSTNSTWDIVTMRVPIETVAKIPEGSILEINGERYWSTTHQDLGYGWADLPLNEHHDYPLH